MHHYVNIMKLKLTSAQSKRMVFFILLVVPTVIQAESAYCTKFGTDNNKPIQDVCEEGDIIEVSDSQVLHYCDFSKHIIRSPIDNEKKACEYIGYIRKFRSRKTGDLRPFTIRE